MRTHGGGSGVRGVVVRVRAVEESECEGGDREAADAAKDAAEDVKEWLEELLNDKELPAAVEKAPIEAEAVPGVDEKELLAPVAEEALAELEAVRVVEEKDSPAVEVKCLAAKVEVVKVAKVKVVKPKEKVPKPAALHPSYLVMIVDSSQLAEICQDFGTVEAVEVIYDQETGRSLRVNYPQPKGECEHEHH
jgi:hypothetical protein